MSRSAALAPKADEPRLWQLLDNGFLQSPTPSIVVPNSPPSPVKKKTETPVSGKPSMQELIDWQDRHLEPAAKQVEAVNKA